MTLVIVVLSLRGIDRRRRRRRLMGAWWSIQAGAFVELNWLMILVSTLMEVTKRVMISSRGRRMGTLVVTSELRGPTSWTVMGKILIASDGHDVDGSVGLCLSEPMRELAGLLRFLYFLFCFREVLA